LAEQALIDSDRAALDAGTVLLDPEVSPQIIRVKTSLRTYYHVFLLIFPVQLYRTLQLGLATRDSAQFRSPQNADEFATAAENRILVTDTKAERRTMR
jgi:hypothetical protein